MGAADRAARRVDGVAALRALARAGLPVHDARPRRGAGDVLHQDALRAQGPVVQLLLVGVLQGLGEVAHDLEALVDAEKLAHLAQKEVETDRLGVVVEDERWPEFGVLVVLDLDDAGVVNAFEDLKLALRLADQRLAGIGGGGSGHGVDANAPADGVHRGVRAFPVLVRGAFRQQRAELVVADLAVLVRRADASFSHGSGQHAGVLLVDAAGLDVADAARPVVERADDAGVGFGRLAARAGKCPTVRCP